MQIIFFQFPLRPAPGGAETATVNTALGLAGKGHAVFLRSSNPYLIARAQKAGIDAKLTWAGWEPTAWWSLLLFPATALVCLAVFAKEIIGLRAGAVVALSLSDKLIALPLARLLRRRAVCVEHTRIGRWLAVSPLKPWYVAATKISRVVTPSYFSRNQIINLGVPADRIAIVPPPTSPAIVPQCLRTPAYTIGFLGRLAYEKGADVLIRALARLPQYTTCIVAGDGPARADLERLARSLGVAPRIHFAGYLDQLDVFFDSIRILAVPSRLPESFGLVAVEAGMRAVPVVASRAGGLCEIIEHDRTGLLVPPNNDTALAEAIEKLHSHPGLRDAYGRSLEKACRARFNNRAAIEAFERLLY